MSDNPWAADVSWTLDPITSPALAHVCRDHEHLFPRTQFVSFKFSPAVDYLSPNLPRSAESVPPHGKLAANLDTSAVLR